MAGSFRGIGLASNAMQAFQRALDTSGHNLANVNTVGYSRQRVEFQSNYPLTFWSSGGQMKIGQGVSVAGINRIRDGYLDRSMSNALGMFGKSSAAASTMAKVDRVFGEPSDVGVASSIEKFFNAWSGLGSNPTDPSARDAVRSAAIELTDKVRTTYEDLRSLQDSTLQTIDASVGEINRLAEQISGLNKEILKSTSSGGSPNDLMDQRDMALDQLSQLVSVQREVNADGQYLIYASGHTLVDSAGVRPFPDTIDPSTMTFTDGSVTYTLKGGTLEGHVTGLQEVQQQMANLDDLAVTMRDEINALHVTGINGQGATGVEFFTSSTLPKVGAAAFFAVSADVLLSSDAIATGLSGLEGDGGLATSIAQTREIEHAALGNMTYSGFFERSIADLATNTDYYAQAAETEEAIVTQIDSQRQAISGVSIDDEMTAMLQYQRSYQAMSRVLTIFDQTTEELIGMLRR